MARYPNKVDTSCHSFNMHVIPLMITLCMAMCSRICQLFKWSNYVSLLTHYPNIIDKSCHNVRVHVGYVFKICVNFCSGEIKYLPWHIIPIEVSVSFYRGEIIN